MTLWEIDREIDRILAGAVDEETGEINEEAFGALDALSMERKDKLINVGLAYKSFKAYAEAIKAEKQALEKRQRQAERKAEWLKDYMQMSLNGEDFKDPKVAVAYRKVSSVLVSEPSIIPDMYLRFKDPEPDKTKIKDAIKAGQVIPGAELVESVSMSIK